MRIGKGVLAGGAVAVGVLGLLFGSGVASGAAGTARPYGMMSYFLGGGSRDAAWAGPWGMMGALWGQRSGGGGSAPYYGMMGGYFARTGISPQSSYPYYGMMGGYFGGATGPSGSAGGSISQSAAATAAAAVPPGATVDRAAKTITFQGSNVRFTAVAGPPGGPELSFEIAGMVNPQIVVPQGARVTVQVINGDTAAPHDFVVSRTVDGSPAFAGAASAVLATAQGTAMPSAGIAFIASTAGSFVYQCTVPGHAQSGMQGKFLVTP